MRYRDESILATPSDRHTTLLFIMTSPVPALSSAAVARPVIPRPALSSIAAQSHTRSIWRAARNSQHGPEKVKHTFRPVNQSTLPRSRPCLRFSGFSAGQSPAFWGSKPEHLLTRMQSVKKEILGEHDLLMKEMRSIQKGIAKDPFSAIFGLKIDVFRELEKCEPTWAGFLRPSPKTTKAASRYDKSHKSTVRNTKFQDTTPEFNRDAFKYDPISGRMVPHQPETGKMSTSSKPVDYANSNKLDTKSSTFPGESPFQLGPSLASRHYVLKPVSKSRPGRELEASDKTNSSAVENAHSSSPLISEVCSSEKFQAESPGVEKTQTELNDGVHLKSGQTVASIPVTELDSPSSPQKDNKSQTGILDSSHSSSLETSLSSDMASVKDLNEDSEPLTSDDIRARYKTIQDDHKLDVPNPPPVKDNAGAVDLTGDSSTLNPQIASQKSIINEEPPTAASPLSPFRILTYDVSEAKVNIAGADSFFGSDQATPLSEVFSRLQNPGKFVPHFSQMEKDGYEIITGGGDILVFRKIICTSSIEDVLPNSQIAKDTHSDPRHADSSTSSQPSSTSKVSRQ